MIQRGLRHCTIAAALWLVSGLSSAASAQAPEVPLDSAYQVETEIRIDAASSWGAVLISGAREMLVAERQAGKASFSIRDAATGRELRRLRPRDVGTHWLTQTNRLWDVSAQGERLVLGVVESGQRYLLVIDTATDEEVKRLPIPENGVVHGVTISPDAGRVAAISEAFLTRLNVWDIESGGQLREINTVPLNSFQFSPDGMRVLTSASVVTGLFGGGVDALAEVWDVASGRSLSQIRVKDAGFNRAVFSPDGAHFLTANRGGADTPAQSDSSATLWNASTGRQVAAIGRGEGAATAVAFSADGSRIATVSMDRRVRIWNAATGALIAVFTASNAPAGPVRIEVAPGAFIELSAASVSGVAAEFAHEGTALVTSGLDGSVKVWVDAGEKQASDKVAFSAALATAQSGDPEAMHRLSSAYRDGRGVDRNAVLATQWLTQAADRGHGAANLELANALLTGDGGRQDCVAGGARLQKAVADGSADAAARLDAVLAPLGGREGAAALTPQIQADLLEAQIIEVLTRQEYPAFLANLCALEALGHAERLPVEARRELLYHRAAGLRAAGKPRAALASLNQYLNEAGNAGANYTQAIQILLPLQEEAK